MKEKAERDDRKPGGDDKRGNQGRAFVRRRGCRFCSDSNIRIDYKDRQLLYPMITERAKIVPRRITGTCSYHQRQLTIAIKRARHMAVISYSSAQI